MQWLLVVSQFVNSAVIVLTTRWDADQRVWFAGLAIPGALLAVWAWFVMGFTKLRITPDVAKNASLVTAPPYRWIRHPMYSGLLLFCLAFLTVDDRWWRIFAFLALAITLEAKSRMEERLLSERFPDYNRYQLCSWRFFPPLY